MRTWCCFCVSWLINGQAAATPDNAMVEYNVAGIPYCKKGCDIPEDCRNNQPPPKPGFKWNCINFNGFCIGKCVQVPRKNGLDRSSDHVDNQGDPSSQATQDDVLGRDGGQRSYSV